jgi:hypothetical protein
MSKQGPRTGWQTSTLLPVLTFLMAAAIFLADTFSPIEIGFAALYVAVVMLSATFLNRQGLVVVGVGCMLLTGASFAIVHGSSDHIGPLIRCLVALFTIGLTTFVGRTYLQAMQESDGQAVAVDRRNAAITPGPLATAVADDLSFRVAVGNLLRSAGLPVKLSGSAAEAHHDKSPSDPVVQIRLSGPAGRDLRAQLSDAGIGVPVVFTTGPGDISMSVKAMESKPHI